GNVEDDDEVVVGLARLGEVTLERQDGALAVEDTERAAPQGRMGMAQGGGALEEWVKLAVPPLWLVPGHRATAIRVFRTRLANLVAVVDTGGARIGHLEEGCQAQGARVATSDRDEARGVVAVQQIELNGGDLGMVEVEQLEHA